VSLFTPLATTDQLAHLHHLGTTDVDGPDIDRPNVEGMLTAAEMFHLEIARMSGNRFLARAVDEVMMRLFRARYLAASSLERRKRAAEEHVAIVEAIRAGHAGEASALIGSHIERAGAYLIERLQSKQGGVMVPFRVVA
jgi:DNA-binding GntR family transcriptional regulator